MERRKINRIETIKDEEGREWDMQEGIGQAFVQHLSKLFQAGPRGSVAKCLGPLREKVTPDRNRDLLVPFTGEKVCVALNQMAALKTPGPDGFTASFY